MGDPSLTGSKHTSFSVKEGLAFPLETFLKGYELPDANLSVETQSLGWSILDPIRAVCRWICD